MAKIPGLEHPVGLVVFIEDGTLSELEGYTLDEPWPSKTDGFSLNYIKEPRDLSMLGPGGSGRWASPMMSRQGEYCPGIARMRQVANAPMRGQPDRFHRPRAPAARPADASRRELLGGGK